MRAGRFTGWLSRGWAAWTARSRLFRAFVALAVLGPLVAVGNWWFTGDHHPAAGKGLAVKGIHDVRLGKPRTSQATVPNARPGKERWPAATTADAALAAQRLDPHNPGSGRTRAGNTPVWVQPVASDKGYSGPSRVTVAIADRASAERLGIAGLVFTATAHGGAFHQPAAATSAGPVRVGVDYNWLTTYYGRNWAAGLRLVQLPACALTSPDKAECRTRSRLPASGIDVPREHTFAQPSALTGDGAPVVLALATDTPTSTGGADGGASGSSNPTDLKASGSWTSGGSKGTFTYAYPIPAPPVANGAAPKLSLDYDSGNVDGQTSATESQADWLGDGWTTPNSYIEQTFTACADKPEGTAAPKKSGDWCYAGPILSMSLGGRTVHIIAQGGKYTASDADGDRIEHITGSNNGSGTYNTDYWRVTDRSGAQFYFGRNQLPGWSSGKPVTNSVDWEPVFSAHQPDGSTYTDPCWDSAGFDKSVCKMAYRWHLDYEVDSHGNAASYYYKQDSNDYTQNAPLTTTDPASVKANASYIRDSHIDHIDYGFRDGQAYSVNGGHAPAQVLFRASPRCISGTCTFPTPTSRGGWLDTPNTLICKIGERCLVSAPTHWSTVRLTGIDTQQWNGTGYTPVDSWEFTQSMPDPGDGQDPTLWLQAITRTGTDTSGGGSAAALPEVTFTPQQLQNRVDKDTSGYGPLNRMRIQKVTSETGSAISVNYFQANPCPTPSSIDPAHNTTSCFPVYWTPPYADKPFRDWFNTYQVLSITQTASVGTDPTGASPTMYTGYNYLGGGGWHFDDNEVVKAKYRTYGQWRGFGKVQTFTGQGGDPQTETETTYYRGLSKATITGATWNDAEGGWEPSVPDGVIQFTGGVPLTDSQGGTHEDVNQLAGWALETTSYNWAGGSANITDSTINSYWVSPPVASRARNALPDLTADAVGQVEQWTRQKVSSASKPWRITETDTSYDTDVSSPTFGVPVLTYEHGDLSDPGHRRCITTNYAPSNEAKNIAALPAEVLILAKACGGASPDGASVPGDNQINTLTSPASYDPSTELVSDSKTIYDDDTLGPKLPEDLDPGSKTHPAVIPTSGNISEVRVADYDPVTQKTTWQVNKATNYDASGFATDTWDAAGAHTHVDRTAPNGIVTKVLSTNPLGQTSTVTLAAGRGLPLTTTDSNGVTAHSSYDGLGRLTTVWSNSRATSQPANLKYSYQISNTGPSSITTQTVNDANGYATSTKLLDAMLRPIQTQEPTPQGGRLLTNIFYDSHGWTWKTNNPYWDAGTTPNTTLAAADDAQIPNQVVNTFDGAGRTILATSYYQSQPREQTATAYLGDKTISVPPPGGVATQTLTDAANRTVGSDTYTSRPTVDIKPGTGTAPITTVSITGGSITANSGKPQSTTYGYDARGNQTDITNQTSGDTWHTDYNTLGQPVIKKDPDAGTSTLQYDPVGRLKQATDANNATVSYTYDLLGRKTGSYHGSTADPAHQIASWTYDNLGPNGQPDIAGLSNPIGQLTSATRYDSSGSATVGGLTGKQRGYTTHVTDGFNAFGQPLAETVTLPDSEGALKGDHTIWHDYTDRVGLHLDDYYDGHGDGPLPEETVTYGWSTVSGLDLPGGSNGNSAYAAGVRYTAYSQVAQLKAGAGSKPAYLTHAWDDHTGRLLDRQFTYTDRSTIPIQEDRYAYDLAGNPTKQTTVRQGTRSETQCFGYDTLDRLTQAWTASDDCAADPATNNGTTVDSGIAGGAYWTSWDLDPLGQRQKETRHGLSGDGDTVTTYKYAGSGNPQPHTLTSTTTVTAPHLGDTPVTTQQQTFAYDKVGNTTQRTTLTHPGQANQSTDDNTLGWSDQGELSTVTTGNGGPSYLYDANGRLLLQKAPGAGTTLYLAGEQLTLTPAGQISGIRYYPQPGGVTAIRSVDTAGTNKVMLETADPHGTGSFTIDTDWNQPTWRQTTPYGAPRGTKPTFWPDNRGFLGDVDDQTTGLTDIGARWYDPQLGRFASLDPLLQATSQQEQNGYTYSAANPVTNSDPSGLATCGRDGPCPKTSDGRQTTPDNRVVPKCVTDGTCDGSPKNETDSSNSTTPSVTLSVYIPPEIFRIGNLAQREQALKNWLAEQVKLTGDGEYHDKYLVTYCSLFPGDHLCAPMADAHGALSVIGMVPGPVGWTVTGINVTWYAADGNWKAAAMEVGLRGLSSIAGKIFGRIFGKLVGRAASRACGDSFVPGTSVLMSDGTSKPIRKIKVGDKVANAIPGSLKGNRDESHMVTAIHVTHADRRYTDVTIATSVGPKTVHGTSGHKYWDSTTHSWVSAGQLKVGEQLQTAWGGSVRILAARTYTATSVTYNLTVDGLHTYYVEAGATPVLVHNSLPCGLRTWQEAGIDPMDAARIQHTADQSHQTIIVVGSRASGTAGDMSDWDYILTGPSKARQSVRNSLPRGTANGNESSTGAHTGMDLFQNYNSNLWNYESLDTTLPHVVFNPR